MSASQAGTATAAASGAAATQRFVTDKSDKPSGAATVGKERVDLLAREVIEAVHATIREHKVTYAEYNALKAWLIKVGADGEWPLFLDVWIEHAVEEVANENRSGSKGTIEGPYYVPDAPRLPAEAALPMREGEAGVPLVFRGTVTGADGTPLPSATVEIWQADDAGYYSQFAPGIPEWNLRGTVVAGESGEFAISTIEPAPYQIPTDGACGELIAAAGWHAWRPAHLHLIVSAPGYRTLTTQLYFRGDTHIGDDIASAVKPELILDPVASAGGGREVGYDFALDRE
ncbi:catechol 1,2-dioxygenase [Prauserella marina]|uniref:Catechol 1,2-dioxygenase n=1 Tax=Prauserella marina TaxID=530584 RepID=A0A222VZR6_9PSEU|nr:catechol 1,2-dioxygenase [Prauserella marina]ASR39282.1 catechol 1,2-dioxygenase [Prauserella marina]PWV84087.1 catechol 1,2-dioxygenase [Prauserella marina]SDC30636.1 catechol 1,2-dioxygenase [Prauserella marina]